MFYTMRILCIYFVYCIHYPIIVYLFCILYTLLCIYFVYCIHYPIIVYIFCILYTLLCIYLYTVYITQLLCIYFVYRIVIVIVLFTAVNYHIVPRNETSWIFCILHLHRGLSCTHQGIKHLGFSGLLKHVPFNLDFTKTIHFVLTFTLIFIFHRGKFPPNGVASRKRDFEDQKRPLELQTTRSIFSSSFPSPQIAHCMFFTHDTSKEVVCGTSWDFV